MNVQEGLLTLFLMCEKEGLSVQLSYENGKYIPGELIDYEHLDDPDPSTVRQGPSGYRVEVGSRSYVDDQDNEKLYPNLAGAVGNGLQLFSLIMEERKNK